MCKPTWWASAPHTALSPAGPVPQASPLVSASPFAAARQDGLPELTDGPPCGHVPPVASCVSLTPWGRGAGSRQDTPTGAGFRTSYLCFRSFFFKRCMNISVLNSIKKNRGETPDAVH